MVAFGVGGATPKQRMTQVAAGLGLLRTTVIDQHFDQRNRYGRLLMIVSQSPQLLGHRRRRGHLRDRDVEDGHEVLRVVGRGAVTILDPASNWSRTPTRPSAPRPCWPAAIVLHVLPAGAAYDLADAGRCCPQHAASRSAEDAAEIAEAQARPPPDGARHRGRRRWPGAPAPTSGPQAHEPQDWPRHCRPHSHSRGAGRRPPVTERPTPDLDDPGDPRLPRRQHLVLRQGDPPGRRPGLGWRSSPPTSSRASPSTCSRRCPVSSTTPARAVAGAASSSGCSEGTWLGHVTEHCRAGAAAGRRARHPPRQDPRREGRAAATTTSSTATSTRTSGSRPAGSRPGWSTTWSRPTRSSTGTSELERFILRAERTAFGPSTQAILDEAVSPRHPVDPAQPVLPGPARPGRPRQADPRHDDLRDQLDRGRHRLRQGPHHPAARRGRAAGAQAGVGAYRRPGRARRPTGSASRWWSSRSTATTAAASASTCRTTTTCARRSRSPRSSRGAAACIVESFVTGKDYRCLIIDGRMAAIAERVPASVTGDGTAR